MDMLYARYSNPMDLMNSYIRRGRFGAFVQNFMEQERERQKAEEEKDNDWRLWIMYIHSDIKEVKSFNDWKADLLGGAKPAGRTGGDHDLDDKSITAIINKLFPG